jgi:predicted amidohydrolase
MQSIRVACVSMNGFLGEPARSLASIEAFSRKAAEQGVDLILFPELVIHGHNTPNTAALAEPVPDGRSCQRLAVLSAELDLVISAGLSEREGDLVYNTQVLFGPDGFIGKQRKIHLSRDETKHYTGGSAIEVFDIGKCKVGTTICYDSQFPEVSRLLLIKGMEVQLMPHAMRECQWQEDDPASESYARRHLHKLLSRYTMRAWENYCFILVTDQAGKAGVVDTLAVDDVNQPYHPGGAMIIAPDAEILGHTQIDKIQDEMIVQNLDAATLDVMRGHENYQLKKRQKQLFGDLI